MSLEMFVGMIAGILMGLLVAFAGAKIAARRSQVVEDERMVMVKAQAGRLALQISGGIAFVGWVVDNLLAYSHGETIQTITPWSIMLLAIIAVYDISLAVYLHRYSAEGGDEVAPKDVAGMILITIAMVPLFFGVQGNVADPGLVRLMEGLFLLLLGCDGWLVYRVWRTKHAA